MERSRTAAFRWMEGDRFGTWVSSTEYSKCTCFLSVLEYLTYRNNTMFSFHRLPNSCLGFYWCDFTGKVYAETRIPINPTDDEMAALNRWRHPDLLKEIDDGLQSV